MASPLREESAGGGGAAEGPAPAPTPAPAPAVGSKRKREEGGPGEHQEEEEEAKAKEEGGGGGDGEPPSKKGRYIAVDDLACQVCCLFRAAMFSTPCGHTLCGSCLKGMRDARAAMADDDDDDDAGSNGLPQGAIKCPTCRAPVLEPVAFPPNLRRLLQEVEVPCDFCEVSVRLSGMEAHHKDCQENPAWECPACKAGLERGRRERHLAEECPRVAVSCDRCGQANVCERANLEEHVELQCPATLREYAAHLAAKNTDDVENLMAAYFSDTDGGARDMSAAAFTELVASCVRIITADQYRELAAILCPAVSPCTNPDPKPASPTGLEVADAALEELAARQNAMVRWRSRWDKLRILCSYVFDRPHLRADDPIEAEYRRDTIVERMLLCYRSLCAMR